jgi:hypothetical protein
MVMPSQSRLALCAALIAIIPASARTQSNGMATRVVSLDGAGFTLTGDGPRSYCTGIETSQKGDRR